MFVHTSLQRFILRAGVCYQQRGVRASHGSHFFKLYWRGTKLHSIKFMCCSWAVMCRQAVIYGAVSCSEKNAVCQHKNNWFLCALVVICIVLVQKNLYSINDPLRPWWPTWGPGVTCLSLAHFMWYQGPCRHECVFPYFPAIVVISRSLI